jgi:hypothetical protein
VRVVFLMSGREWEGKLDLTPAKDLARALVKGLRAVGDEIEVVRPPKRFGDLGCDFVAGIGMKRRRWFKWCAANGQRFLYFDKGYWERGHTRTEGEALWRVSVDALQSPLDFLATAHCGPERWNDLGRTLHPWQKPTPDGHIVIATSSAKYHDYHGLPEPAEWAAQVAAEIRRYTDRPIWYRPKPSQTQKGRSSPVHGAHYAITQTVDALFTGCHALITHGSYISVDALLAGVPSIILGPAVTRPISSTDLADIETPLRASDEARRQLLANLAHCQYRLQEWATFAWPTVKELFVH